MTVDPQTREFQKKFLHRIVYTSKAWTVWGIFIHCEITSCFWLTVRECLKDYFINLHNLNATYITFMFLRNDSHLLNHIIVLCKQVIIMMLLDLQVLQNEARAWLAFEIQAWISSSPSLLVDTLDPRKVKCSTFSNAFPFNIMASLVLLFILKCLVLVLILRP